MKISIITVSLNAVKTIEQTINSVLGQDYSDVEYIIIDGGSDDGTVDIIEKYDKQLFFWSSEPDYGIYDAMNKGIGHATGEVIGIINADDWYDPDALENVSKIMSSTKSDIICGAIRVYDKNDNYINVAYSENLDPWQGMNWAHPATFVRKEVYDKLGGYDISYKIAADYKFLLTCTELGKLFFITDKIFANFRNNGVSNMNYDLETQEVYRAKTELIESVVHDEKRKDILRKKALENLKYSLGKYSFLSRKEGIKPCLLKIMPEINDGIYIWGYGQIGHEVVNAMCELGIEIIGIVDKKLFTSDKDLNNNQVMPICSLKGTTKSVLICVRNDRNSIEKQAKELQIEKYYFVEDVFKKLGNERCIERGK